LASCRKLTRFATNTRSYAQPFLTGVFNEELRIKDVTWINASGAEMKPEEWAT